MENKKGQLSKRLPNCTELQAEWIFDRSIVSIKKDESSEMMIAMAMGNMQEALNIDKAMTAQQLQEVAKEIIIQFGHFKMQDISVFCHGCKFGRYGKAYNRLNGQIIFEWLIEFDKQRTALIHSERQRQREEIQSLQDQVFANDITFESVLESYKLANQEGKKKRKLRQEREQAERENGIKVAKYNAKKQMDNGQR